jgi:hypothetical protein
LLIPTDVPAVAFFRFDDSTLAGFAALLFCGFFGGHFGSF